MTQFNPISVYRDSGFKAGQARKRGDEALARFESDWAKRAIALESGDYKTKARQAFNEGYAMGARR